MTAALAEIAASVAKALGMTDIRSFSEFRGYEGTVNGVSVRLYADGYNVFDCAWQVRCRDWLLERGEVQQENSKHSKNWNAFTPFNDTAAFIEQPCPPAEFYARAIHQLLTVRND